MEDIRNKMFGIEEIQQKSAVARNDPRELWEVKQIRS
jgi:hypothetical protein